VGKKTLDRMGWDMIATNGQVRQDVEGEKLKGRADVAPVMKRRPSGCMGVAVVMDHRPVESEGMCERLHEVTDLIC